MKTLQQLTRSNIWNLKPYSSARDEYKGIEASVFLDANENPYNAPVNRYPDPLQNDVKALIAPIKKVAVENIFLGNGSDEAIDMVYRTFCEPRIDNVVAIDPTYGMYEVCAEVNDIEYRKVLLDEDYQFSADKLMTATDEHTKLIFLCSPNNPTGNCMKEEEIVKLLQAFDGFVVLDEAYNDFSEQPSFLYRLNEFTNLIVLQTFSKAWGCAAIRLGMAFAKPEVIQLFNKVKYPYNVNRLTQLQAIQSLQKYYEIERWVHTLILERERLMKAFSQLPCCIKVFPTDANFFLTRVTNAVAIYKYLVNKGIIVRNRSHISLCQGCLRITVGTRLENDMLLQSLNDYKPE